MNGCLKVNAASAQECTSARKNSDAWQGQTAGRRISTLRFWQRTDRCWMSAVFTKRPRGGLASPGACECVRADEPKRDELLNLTTLMMPSRPCPPSIRMCFAWFVTSLPIVLKLLIIRARTLELNNAVVDHVSSRIIPRRYLVHSARHAWTQPFHLIRRCNLLR